MPRGGGGSRGGRQARREGGHLSGPVRRPAVPPYGRVHRQTAAPMPHTRTGFSRKPPGLGWGRRVVQQRATSSAGRVSPRTPLPRRRRRRCRRRGIGVIREPSSRRSGAVFSSAPAPADGQAGAAPARRRRSSPMSSPGALSPATAQLAQTSARLGSEICLRMYV